MIVSRVTMTFEHSGWAGRSRQSVREAFARLAHQDHHSDISDQELTLGQVLYRALVEQAVGA